MAPPPLYDFWIVVTVLGCVLACLLCCVGYLARKEMKRILAPKQRKKEAKLEDYFTAMGKHDDRVLMQAQASGTELGDDDLAVNPVWQAKMALEKDKGKAPKTRRFRQGALGRLKLDGAGAAHKEHIQRNAQRSGVWEETTTTTTTTTTTMVRRA